MNAPSALDFQTLRRPVEARGIGLHTGLEVAVRLCPRAEPGISFVRTDLPAQPEIPAASQFVAGTTHATTLAARGATVSTTEHLLAALWALDITHCRVELNGPELPILDGSAAEWCRLIAVAGAQAVPGIDGRRQRPVWALREPVWVSDGAGSVLGLPHPHFRLTAAVDFGLDYVGLQTCDVNVTAASFTVELAAARTFTLDKWIEPLRAQGLIKGGSTDNAIVLDGHAPSSPWRFPNELARHKALDVVGDVALLLAPDGGILSAHLIAIRAGHDLHRRWIEACLHSQALIPA